MRYLWLWIVDADIDVVIDINEGGFQAKKAVEKKSPLHSAPLISIDPAA